MVTLEVKIRKKIRHGLVREDLMYDDFKMNLFLNRSV